MPKKIVTGEFKGHTISVENTWLNGMKLLHNGQEISRNDDAFALKKHTPIMSGKILIDEVENSIEVFAYAVFTVKLQIRVNGKYIAGDKF